MALGLELAGSEQTLGCSFRGFWIDFIVVDAVREQGLEPKELGSRRRRSSSVLAAAAAPVPAAVGAVVLAAIAHADSGPAFDKHTHRSLSRCWAPGPEGSASTGTAPCPPQAHQSLCSLSLFVSLSLSLSRTPSLRSFSASGVFSKDANTLQRL